LINLLTATEPPSGCIILAACPISGHKFMASPRLHLIANIILFYVNSFPLPAPLYSHQMQMFMAERPPFCPTVQCILHADGVGFLWAWSIYGPTMAPASPGCNNFISPISPSIFALPLKKIFNEIPFYKLTV